MDSRNIGNFQNVSRETHFTPGFEAKGWGKSCDPIGWELKANPKSFRLGVKANNQLNILIYKILALRWSPRHRRNPHGLGGQRVHKELAWASKELKYWLSWPQVFAASTNGKRAYVFIGTVNGPTQTSLAKLEQFLASCKIQEKKRRKKCPYCI